jgi:hypothetical protein
MAEEYYQLDKQENEEKDNNINGEITAKEEVTPSTTFLTSQQEECRCLQLRKPANLDRPEGEYNLREELESLYTEIVKCDDQKNPMVYNQCCLNFTTKKLQKKSNHPNGMQLTCLKFFKLKHINSQAQFIEEMMKEIKSFPSHHQFIPSTNQPHCQEMKKTHPNQRKME